MTVVHPDWKNQRVTVSVWPFLTRQSRPVETDTAYRFPLGWFDFPFTDIHVSLCQGEKNPPDARYGGARTANSGRTRSSHPCLSAMVPAFAEPDIHSLSQILTDRHRRLSVCSLPVLKQFGESLGSFDLRRSVGNRRTWQSARCGILLFFA